MTATPADDPHQHGHDDAAAARLAVLNGEHNVWMRAKIAVYRALYPQDGDSRWLDSFIITLIAFNVIAVVIETEEVYTRPYHVYFLVFEWFSSLFFTVEYVLRLWVVDLDYDPRRPWRSRLKYVFSFMAMVDLVAVVPFYLPMLITMDLRFVRAIRLLRLFRILKMGRYAHAVRTMAGVFARKKEELAMTGFILVVLLVLSASGIYFVEHVPVEAQSLGAEFMAQNPQLDPTDKVQNPEDPFRSIPGAMWWAVITLTSVGYGDVVPASPVGKFVAAIVSLVGVGFIALPTGILAAGFAEQMREQRIREGSMDMPGYCPHCGEAIVPEAEFD